MNKNYVPSKQDEYYTWQLNLVEMVTNNSTTWGISAAIVTDLNDRSSAYRVFYDAIKNKKTRTSQQVYAHQSYKKTYTKFLRGIVQGQLVNNPAITADELVAMGLNPHLYIRAERPKITDKPTIAPANVGGGKVRLRCTTPGIDTRGIHPDSNGIELYYVIEGLVTKVNPVEPDTDSGNGQSTDPQFVASFYSKRANFIRDFGLNSVGKVLRIYGRWVNTSDADNNGPYGSIANIVIS